jgi:hypothetical protein
MYDYEPVNADIVVVNPSSWVFNNTGLTNGSHITGLLGYEVDREFGDQPANTVLLAHSPYVTSSGQTQYADMTIYQAASGAWVFAAGTIRWGWGLSNVSPFDTPGLVNAASQQITQNLLNQFIAQVGPTPIVTLAPTSINCGTHRVGTTSNWQTVNVKNVGTVRALIYGISIINNQFVETSNCSASLNSGKTCAIQVQLRPTQKGKQSGQLMVSDNAQGSPQVVQLSGKGT